MPEEHSPPAERSSFVIRYGLFAILTVSRSIPPLV